MKQNRTLLMVVGVICLFLCSYSDGNTEDNTDRWVYYGTSDDGDCYYDNSSITKVSSDVIKVSTKLKYSKEGKNQLLQLRKDYSRPIDGWNKLDNTIIVFEMDCSKKTSMFIEIVDNNDKGEILLKDDFLSSEIDEIEPGGLSEILFKIVCSSKPDLVYLIPTFPYYMMVKMNDLR